MYLIVYNGNNIQRLISYQTKNSNNGFDGEAIVDSPLYENHNVEIKEKRKRDGIE